MDSNLRLPRGTLDSYFLRKNTASEARARAREARGGPSLTYDGPQGAFFYSFPEVTRAVLDSAQPGQSKLPKIKSVGF